MVRLDHLDRVPYTRPITSVPVLGVSMLPEVCYRLCGSEESVVGEYTRGVFLSHLPVGDIPKGEKMKVDQDTLLRDWVRSKFFFLNSFIRSILMYRCVFYDTCVIFKGRRFLLKIHSSLIYLSLQN